MVKAVVFDLDDTLIDWRAAHERYCRQMLSDYAPNLADAQREDALLWLMRLAGDGNVPLSSWIPAARERLGIAKPYEELLHERTRVFPEYTLPRPDMREVLGELSARYPLGLITNGEGRVQRRKIAVAGIESFFSSIWVSGEVGIAKPDKRIFILCMAAMGIRPQDAVYVGDNIRNDVRGALAAGMRAVHFKVPAYESCDGAPKIASLGELPALIKSM